MNQNPTSTGNEGLPLPTNLSGNPQNRSFGGNPQFNNSNPTGDPQIRMQQPNLRNLNFAYQQSNIHQQQQPQQQYQQQQPPQQQYQQQQQQQFRNMYQQDPRPQHTTDPSLFQANHGTYNNNFRPPIPPQNSANNEFQRGYGNAPQMQRVQPVPQPRFSDVRPPSMPPLNGSSSTPKVDQPKEVPNFLNHQQMESQKFQASEKQMSGAEQVPDSLIKNENANKSGPQPLLRRESNLTLNQPQATINQQKPPEAEFRPAPVPQNVSKPSQEKNSDLSNSQPLAQSKVEDSKPQLSRSSTKNSVIGKIEKPPIENQDKSETVEKEKIKKETNKPKGVDNGITSGLVHKNIKFFEENDTAKIPLRPQTLSINRKERTESVSSDVIRGDYSEGDSESGVDDSPMIHPNLKSIFQAPSKVAKLPYMKPKKKFSGSRKLKPLHFSDEELKQNKPGWKFSYKSTIKSIQNFSQQVCRHGLNHKQKVTKFKPEEELLSFFYNTHLVRKMKLDGNTKSEQNAAKDKVAHKPTTNGDIGSPKKTPSKLPGPSKKTSAASSPTKTPLKSPGTPGTKSLPKTPETPSPPTPLIKKVPMNKIQVGAAPSPNLKTVRSKVGSLANTTHKPGGGNVRIESHKIDFSKAQPRIAAKNDQYAPSGGDKKITQVKLQWSAKSKVGSLENATYKPGGGDKKIESVKLDFKDKAKPKVGSKDNVKHVPGGGTVKIENQKLEFKAQSKVGSLDNVKHKPGGGDIKIFDDKTYLKQISGNSSEGRVSGTQSYGDLSVVREVVGRSAPGTPGRKTAVKIKRTTTIHSTGASPSIKNVTEVMVESQTPKKSKNIGKSPSKQQVKLTYSKFSSSTENTENKNSVEVVKVAAKENAPILKPNLGNRKALSSFDEDNVTISKRITASFDNREPNKDVRYLDCLKQSSESSDLLNDKTYPKNDSGKSKFLEDEIAAREKVGEMWKEMNSLGSNVQKEWKEPIHQPVHSNMNSGSSGFSSQHQRPQNTTQFYEQRANNPQGNSNTPQFSSTQPSQNVIRPIQSQNIYHPTPFTQTQ